jgi:hypothetical protein
LETYLPLEKLLELHFDVRELLLHEGQLLSRLCPWSEK